MRRPLALGLSAGLLCATAGVGAPACGTSARTQIIVVIQSDMAVPQELDGFRARVRGPDGSVVSDRPFSLGRRDGQVVLPADFGISPKGNDASRVVTVEVTAMLGEEDLFVNRAVTRFLRGQSLRLDMFLAGRCVQEALSCDAGQTCRAEGCVDAEVDPTDLPIFEPNQPSDTPDASGSDAGVEGDSGGTDGAPSDSSVPDGGSTDSGTDAAVDSGPPLGGVIPFASSGDDEITGLAIDGAGNHYVAGNFVGTLDLGGMTLSGTGSGSAFLASYTPEGQLRWGQALTSTGSASVAALAIDDDDDLFVAGNVVGTYSIGSNGGSTGNGGAAFMAGYSPTGGARFVQAWSGSGPAEVEGLAVGAAGAVALTGTTSAPIDFGGGPIAPSGTSGFLAVFADERRHVLSGAITSPTTATGRDVAITSGRYWVAGSFVEELSSPWGALKGVGTGSDVFLMSSDLAMTGFTAFGGDGADQIHDLAVGGTAGETPYLAGRVTGGAVIGPVDLGGTDAVVARFDGDGTEMWSTRFGSARTDAAWSVTGAATGQVLVGGFFGDTITAGDQKVDSAGETDGFLATLRTSDGRILRFEPIGGTGRDEVNVVAYDPLTGDVVVAGTHTAPLVVAGTQLTSGRGVDAYVARFAAPTVDTPTRPGSRPLPSPLDPAP